MLGFTWTRFLQQVDISLHPEKVMTAGAEEGQRMVRRARAEVALQVFLTLGSFALAAYILLSGKFDLNIQKLAGGWVGVVLGYWLR
jgi:hypothetical protein